MARASDAGPDDSAPSDNRLNIRRDALTALILNGVGKPMVESPPLRVFCAAFTRDLNRLGITRGAEPERWKQELERADKKPDKTVDAIAPGCVT